MCVCVCVCVCVKMPFCGVCECLYIGMCARIFVVEEPMRIRSRLCCV